MAIKLKLLIDKEKNRVVLAESDKYFVDTLFSFLTIPIGAIVRLSSQKSNIGCMDALQESVKNLDSQYLQTEAVKEMLLCPKSSWESQAKDLALNVDTELTRYYVCTSCYTGSHPLISTVKNVQCRCGQEMAKEVVIKKSKPAADGINEGVTVKETMRFTIGDDLRVSPISTETSLSLLHKLGVRDWTALEEKNVDVGANEALRILRRLFVSTTPLTDVFLRKPEALEDAFDSLKLSPKDIVIDKKDTRKEMSLKLLINKSNNKAVYAEATTDFLDLLISFLTFPLGSVVKLLGPGSSIGCLDNFHKSVEDLSGGDDCIISEECRAMLLDPKLSPHSGCDSQLLPVVEAGPKTIYPSEFSSCFHCGCDNGHDYSKCSGVSIRELHFINPKVSRAATKCGGGFVKGPNLKFMVTDGLDVKPLSFISGITILDRFNVRISDVQNRVVSVGVEEAFSLLKASLSSKTVLSDVFCQKNANQSKIKLERK
ncbi:uncharacterized protein LOC131240730 [Magnolia sinica]|uniref:uncharacterized protein LOC131240730 n=1 Tax=Magnolia sinica TaxID=86752 RepID=UPI0026594E77|nr:uncharacterized protein LOC131240730 [Magnolia sinica]